VTGVVALLESPRFIPWEIVDQGCFGGNDFGKAHVQSKKPGIGQQAKHSHVHNNARCADNAEL